MGTVSYTHLDLALSVLDYLGDYYSIYYNYIENKTNLHFQIVYHSDNGKEQSVYTNAPDMTVEEMKASGRYLYIPGNTIRMDSNLTDVPVNVAPYLEMWNPYGNNKYYMIVAVDTSCLLYTSFSMHTLVIRQKVPVKM